MKTASLEKLQLISRFEYLRRTLSVEQYARHRERTLAYWALPADRSLPIAFLGRTLRDLLQTPYAELAATPGIGRKKMQSLLKLLGRVVNTDSADLPDEQPAPADDRGGRTRHNSQDNGFDASAVSELLWDRWRAAVIEHGFAQEPIGRLASSLRGVSRVIWNTPLAIYAEKTLAEMRAMKTHGKKRVGAILEVFHDLHAAVAHVDRLNHLALRVVPRQIDAVETWVGATIQRPGIPDRQEIFACFVEPLLEQLRRDASSQIVELAERRLGVQGPLASVRQAARGLGLTRARIYQLLNEINDILAVRWPLGRSRVYELRDKFRLDCQSTGLASDLAQFDAAVDLFFPSPRPKTAHRTYFGAKHGASSLSKRRTDQTDARFCIEALAGASSAR